MDGGCISLRLKSRLERLDLSPGLPPVVCKLSTSPATLMASGLPLALVCLPVGPCLCLPPGDLFRESDLLRGEVGLLGAMDAK
jgi:hypothetical protein